LENHLESVNGVLSDAKVMKHETSRNLYIVICSRKIIAAKTRRWDDMSRLTTKSLKFENGAQGEILRVTLTGDGPVDKSLSSKNCDAKHAKSKDVPGNTDKGLPAISRYTKRIY
jgi:hypothetical protein